MQEPEKLICTFHVSYPCIKSPVLKPISKSRETEDDRKDRVRWVNTSNYVSYNLAQRSQDYYTTLSELSVDFVVQQCREDVSQERS